MFEKNKYETRRKTHRWILMISVLLIGVALVFCHLGVRPVHIRGSSMFPAMFHGDVLVGVERFDLQRFDQVTLTHENSALAKRIIGVPGDTIRFTANAIIINDQLLHEYYLTERASYPKGLEVTLEANQYFVMGDNRNISYDSRYFGPVHVDQIDGKILSRLWRH